MATELKIHLGCGVDVLPGYVNVDDLSDYEHRLELLQSAHEEDGAWKAYADKPVDMAQAVVDGRLLITNAHTFIKGLANASVDIIESQRFLGRDYFKANDGLDGGPEDEVEDYHELARVLKPGGKVIMKQAITSCIDFLKLTKCFDVIKITVCERELGDTFVDIVCLN